MDIKDASISKANEILQNKIGMYFLYLSLIKNKSIILI